MMLVYLGDRDWRKIVWRPLRIGEELGVGATTKRFG